MFDRVTAAAASSQNDFARRVLVVALCSIALTSSARAENEKPPPRHPPAVVFASYRGHLPEHEPAEVAELRADLEALGCLAQPSSIMSAIGDSVPLPGIMDRGSKPTGLTRVELLDAVEVGYQAWASANFADAASTLVRALARLRRNPALLVTDASNLAVIYRAYLILALSEAKLDKPEVAEQVMEELIRMFPNQPVVRGDAGPEAWELYRSVLRHVQEKGRGRLVVDTGNEQAIIFVDDQLRGTSRVELADVIPGVHYVFVQVIGTLGRQYRIDVSANKVSTLSANWDVDQATWLTETDAAIVFPTESDQAKESVYTSSLIRHGRGRQLVVIAPVNGKPVVRGTSYDADGRMMRSATVEIDHDKSARLRVLADFLVGRSPAPSLRVLADDAAPAAPRGALSRSRSWRGPVVAGLGIALGGAGIAVFKSAANDNGHVPLFHDRREIGLGISLLGGAAVGGGVYLLCRDRLDMRVLPAALLAGGAAALASGISLYAVSEDPSPHLGTKIIHSAPEGIAAGATGLAMAGAGLWFALRGSTDRPPIVTLQRGGGAISWGGTF